MRLARRTPEQVDRLRKLVGNIGDAHDAAELLNVPYWYAFDLLKQYRAGIRGAAIARTRDFYSDALRRHG